MIELTKDYIENLKSIIEAKDDAKAQEVLHELYPADIAELYQELNLQEAIYLYLLMDGDKAADVLMELDEEDRHKLLKELPNELIAKRFVDNMETDDAVDLMRELDEDTQEAVSYTHLYFSMKNPDYRLPLPPISRCQQKGIVTIQALYQAKSQDNNRFHDIKFLQDT